MLEDIQNIIEHTLNLFNYTFLFILIRSLGYSQTFKKFRLLIIHLHKLENMVYHSPIKKQLVEYGYMKCSHIKKEGSNMNLSILLDI
jgi:hypothetical protein